MGHSIQMIFLHLPILLNSGVFPLENTENLVLNLRPGSVYKKYFSYGPSFFSLKLISKTNNYVHNFLAGVQSFPRALCAHPIFLGHPSAAGHLWVGVGDIQASGPLMSQ